MGTGYWGGLGPGFRPPEDPYEPPRTPSSPLEGVERVLTPDELTRLQQIRENFPPGTPQRQAIDDQIAKLSQPPAPSTPPPTTTPATTPGTPGAAISPAAASMFKVPGEQPSQPSIVPWASVGDREAGLRQIQGPQQDPSVLNVLDERGEVINPEEWKARAAMRENLYPTRGAVDPVLGTGSFDVRPGPGGYVPSVQIAPVGNMDYAGYRNELTRLEGINQLAAQTLTDRWKAAQKEAQGDLEQRKGEAEIAESQGRADLAHAGAEKARRTYADEIKSGLDLMGTAIQIQAHRYGVDPSIVEDTDKAVLHRLAIEQARKDPDTIKRKIKETDPEFQTQIQKKETELIGKFIQAKAAGAIRTAEEMVPMIGAAAARTRFE